MKIRNMVLCALFAAVLALCAWLSVPMGSIAFTMQTFGVFLTLGLLGGKRGTAAIAVYLLLGVVGVPVFSGFRGGVGILLGATGGYLTGFLFAGLVYRCITARFPHRQLLAMVAGLLTCYLFGTVWYYFAYARTSVAAILLQCVVPYLLPDALKLGFALFLTRRLKHLVY